MPAKRTHGATAGSGPEAPSGSTLRSLLDLSSSLLLVCEPDGRVVWANRAVRSTLGVDVARSGAASATALAELFHSEDATPVVSAVRQARRRPVQAAAEQGSRALSERAARGLAEDDHPRPAQVVRARARHRDGSWRLLEWIVRSAMGERPLVLLAGRDLTEGRAATDAERAGEATLRAVVEHSPSPVFVQDLEGRYLLLNQEWASLAGCTVTGMLGFTDDECQPANATALGSLRQRVLDHGGSVDLDVTLETGTGRRDLLLTAFGLSDDDAVVYAVCFIATDISDRKQLATSLAERERVLESVFEASPDVITLLDTEGRVARVSAAGHAFFGHDHESSAGAELFPYVHPEDFDQVASNFIRLATGSTTRAQARYRAENAEGRWVTLDTRWQALVDDSDRFTGAVVVARDVSARLESEQRLLALRRSAEEANQAKSDFLSRMSHELRTPLNSILGFAQLLEMDDLPLQQADSVQHILRGGDHLLAVIDEVLDISRLETGHLELSSRPVPVSVVVAEAAEAVRSAAEVSQVTIRCPLSPDDDVAVLGDRKRLVQVLSNLLSNAVKYNRPGGFVDVSCTLGPAGRVRVAVSDSGRGIRSEDLSKVFDPFERLGAEQSGIEGSGVGLALSRMLVAKMGGLLEVESVPGVGTTFFVELPQAVVPGRAQADRSTSTEAAVGVFGVLLVEPDLSSLELVERALSRRPGVVVERATRGGAALEMARASHPGLILLDLHLPDMPGSTLLDHLGQDEATAGIPVAVLTPDAASGQVRSLLGRGVAGQVTKPIDVRALLSLVDAVRSASGR